MRVSPVKTMLLATAALTLTVFAPAVPGAQAQTSSPQLKDDLFAGTDIFAKGATKVTEVDMDHNALADVNGSSHAANDAHKMDLTVVHEYRYDKPGMYRIEDVEAFRKKLQDGSWHCQVHTSEHSKSGDRSTDICYRPGPDHESVEQVIITVEPLKLTFIHNRGRSSMTGLERMGWNSPADQMDMMQLQIQLSMLGSELGSAADMSARTAVRERLNDYTVDHAPLRLMMPRTPPPPPMPAQPVPADPKQLQP